LQSTVVNRGIMMPFPFLVPATVTALARQRALGARRAVFWRRRAIRPWLLWVLTVVALGVAILVGLQFGEHVVALALIGAFLAGTLLVRYGVVADCAVVYEHGLVRALGGQLRSVRWDEARYSWRGPADLAILPRADDLAATGDQAAPGLSGKDGRLVVRRVSGMDRLQQLIDAELQPRALARGQAQLAAEGRADYPPLAITPAGVFANPGSGTVHAPWAAVDSYQRTGGSLAISAFVSDPAQGRTVREWFRGLVADATAAERLMDATDPDPATPQADAAALVAADLAAGAVQVRRRASRRRWRVVIRQAIPYTALVVGGALLATIHPPVNGLGYAGVCSGEKAAQAAAYTGSGPHPIDFEGGSGGFAGVTDNAGVLEGESPDWAPASAAAVQLVACVTGTQTLTQLDTCQYTGQDVPVDDEQYTISVYAAQTGARVAGPQTIDGDNWTCPDTITVVNGSGPSAFYSSLTLSDVDSAVAGAVSSPAP
jgi:hypothetical protein